MLFLLTNQNVTLKPLPAATLQKMPQACSQVQNTGSTPVGTAIKTAINQDVTG